jgi:hypothetical protein
MILENKSGGKLVIHGHRRVRTRNKAVALSVTQGEEMGGKIINLQ